MVIRTSADRAFVRVGSVQLQLQRGRNKNDQDCKRRKAYLCPVRYHNSQRRVDGKRRAAPADVCLRRKRFACRHGIPQFHNGCKCNGGVPVRKEHSGRYTARIQQHREQACKLRVRRMGEYNLHDVLKRRRHICGAVQSVHIQRLLP